MWCLRRLSGLPGTGRCHDGRMEDAGAPRVWTVEDHLRGQEQRWVDLFRAVEAAILACGPVTHAVSRTTITFKGTRRGFAGARPTPRGVDGYLDLMRPLSGDPRIRRSEPYTGRLHVNHYRLTAPEQLDDTFRDWLAEAYAVGQGAHLRR
jgi:hypothetical protein